MKYHVKKIRLAMVLVVLFSIAFAFLLSPLAKIPLLLEEQAVEQETDIVKNTITEDLLRLQKTANVIADSNVLNRYIQNNDSFGLLGILTDELKKNDVGLLMALNQEGIILARTHNQSLRGDYIFDTTNFGTALYQEGNISSVEESTQLPLFLVAGATFLEKEDIGGAILAGYLTDSEYAERIKRENLRSDTQIIFYSNEKGIVGHTFDDERIGDILHSNFDATFTKIDFDTISSSVDRVLLDGRQYHLRHHSLQGISDNKGGFIVLVEHNVLFEYGEDLVVSVISTLIFGLLLLLVLNYTILKKLYNTFRNANKIVLFLLISPALIFFFILVNKLDDARTHFSKSFFSLVT